MIKNALDELNWILLCCNKCVYDIEEIYCLFGDKAFFKRNPDKKYLEENLNFSYEESIGTKHQQLAGIIQFKDGTRMKRVIKEPVFPENWEYIENQKGLYD